MLIKFISRLAGGIVLLIASLTALGILSGMLIRIVRSPWILAAVVIIVTMIAASPNSNKHKEVE